LNVIFLYRFDAGIHVSFHRLPEKVRRLYPATKPAANQELSHCRYYSDPLSSALLDQTDAALKTALEPMIDKYQAATGYIDGLPGLK
jgi:hypothetical protein